MQDLKKRTEALSRIEFELREEMAASLGRIGRTLEHLIHQLKTLEKRIHLASMEERDLLLSQFRFVRGKAQLYQWYLAVQREAIGIRNHENVLAEYRIPGIPMTSSERWIHQP